MRDDRLQGILFEQSNLVDLVHHTKLERLMTKVKSTKRQIKVSYVARQANRPPQPVEGLKVDKKNQADLADLIDRFEARQLNQRRPII